MSIERFYTRLKLDEIGEWAENVWKSSLSDVALPETIREHLRQISKILVELNRFLSTNEVEANRVTNGILALVAGLSLPLSPFSSNSTEKMNDKHSVDDCIIALELYFRLLAVHNAENYQIFHPTLFESAFQILTNILLHYSSKTKRKFELTNTARRALQGPMGALSEMFKRLNIPKQFMESTVKHVMNYFTLTTMSEREEGSVEAMVLTLAKKEDTCLAISGCLIKILTGREFPVHLTRLSKIDDCLWQRANKIFIQGCTEKNAEKLLMVLAENSLGRQLSADLTRQAARSMILAVENHTKEALCNRVVQMMRMDSVKIRCCGVNFARMILSCDVDDIKIDSEKTKKVLYALVSRCRDNSANVQVKAIKYTIEILEGLSIDQPESILGPGRFRPTRLDMPSRESSSSQLGRRSQASDVFNQSTTSTTNLRRTCCETILLNEDNRVVITRKFASDETGDILAELAKSPSVHVRKIILGFIKVLVLHKLIEVDDNILQLFKNGCHDSLQSVRVSSIQTYTQLVTQLEDNDVSDLSITVSDENKLCLVNEWMKTLLPMINDMELPVKEAASTAMFMHITEKLVQFPNHFIYDSLQVYDTSHLADFKTYFGWHLLNIKKNNKLTDKQWLNLHKNIEDRLEDGPIFWIIYSILLKIKKEIFDTELSLAKWNSSISQQMVDTDCQESAYWSTKFLKDLLPLMPYEQANMIHTCINTYLQKSSTTDKKLLKVFCEVVRVGATEEIKAWITSEFSLRKLELLLSKISDRRYDDLPVKIREAEVRMLLMSEFYEYYKKDELEKLSELFVSLVTDDEVPSSFVESTITASARASMQNHTQAERVVYMFGNQLIDGKTPGIQVAALVALSDLCKAKTQLVDKFMDVISSTLELPCEILVKNALKQLTLLLKQDYVKLRPSLLSQMLILAANERQANEIRELAQYCLQHILSPRKPELFYGNFTQILIVCTGALMLENPGADRLISTQTQRDIRTQGGLFVGPQNRKNRRKIYDFCIENMTDKQRLKLLNKLKVEVFEAPQRNTSVLTSTVPMTEAIYDAIDLIHKHEMLQFKLTTGTVTGDEEDEDDVGSIITNYDRKLSEVRKNYLSIKLFPELYDLRETMQAHNSSSLVNLIRLMVDLMTEIDTIKDLDPKYKNLKEELSGQIEILEEEGTEDYVQEPMSTTTNLPENKRKNAKSKQRRSILDLSRSFARSPVQADETSTDSSFIINKQGPSGSSKSADKENRPKSTPVVAKNARVSVGSGFSSIHNNTSQVNQTNGTISTEGSFVISKPK